MSSQSAVQKFIAPAGQLHALESGDERTVASPSTFLRACFAVFARDTVPSDLPFMPKFQISLASLLSLSSERSSPRS